MNRIILIGRLTADPELRYTPTGTAVASFTLAVDRPRANQNGEKETDFIPIVVWQKLAELCAQYLRKGKLAAVDGRLQLRSYENKEGQRVRVAEVVAETVRFLERADNGQGGGNGGASGAQGNDGGRYGGYNGNGGNVGGYTGQNGGYGGGNYDGGGYGSGQRGGDPFSDDGKPIDISDDDLPF